jgi:MFS family permease
MGRQLPEQARDPEGAGWHLAFPRPRFLPPETTPDARLLVSARGVRAFGDGVVSILLPLYLLTRGFNALEIGIFTTTTLVGSAAVSLLVGLIAHRFRRRTVLFVAAVLMIATGIAFAVVEGFWPLLLVAFIGTLNPSGGDVSLFLPLEQSLLPQTVSDRQRTALFARYSLVGTLVAACGALCAGLPAFLAARAALDQRRAIEGVFLLYALLGGVALLLYRQLSPRIEPESRAAAAPLHESRGIVYTLAALFSLDSFGGGFVVQSLLALWLFQRFGLSAATAGTIFFWTGVCSAGSYLVAVPLARRIGLVNTMVFTHLPSNLFLVLVPFMPNLPLAILLLLARSALSQMDVPTRNSYVMAIVPPAERTAAASVTTVPRSLATAASPLLAGYLFGLSAFGWPLVIGGALKAIYDLIFLAMFTRVRPPEEAAQAERQATK